MAGDILDRAFGFGELLDGDMLETHLDKAGLSTRANISQRLGLEGRFEPDIVDKPLGLTKMIDGLANDTPNNGNWGQYTRLRQLQRAIARKLPNGPQTYLDDEVRRDVYEIRRNFDSKDYKDSVLIVSAFNEDTHEQLWCLGSYCGPLPELRSLEQWEQLDEAINLAMPRFKLDLIKAIAPEFGIRF